MTGFSPEDKDFAARTKWPWQVFGYLGLGLAYPLISQEVYEEGEYKNPYLIPGLISVAVGAYSYWYYINHPQLVTYELATEISSEYNKKLIAKMIE